MEEYNLTRVNPHLPHLPLFLVVFESKLRFPNHLKPQSTCTRGILVLNTGFENCFAHLCLFYIPAFAELRRNGMEFTHLHQNLEVVWANISLSHDTWAIAGSFLSVVTLTRPAAVFSSSWRVLTTSELENTTFSEEVTQKSSHKVISFFSKIIDDSSVWSSPWEQNKHPQCNRRSKPILAVLK